MRYSQRKENIISAELETDSDFTVNLILRCSIDAVSVYRFQIIQIALFYTEEILYYCKLVRSCTAEQLYGEEIIEEGTRAGVST